MATYSIAEAEHRLSELIDCALAGEKVFIARNDLSMVELTAPEPRSEPLADAGTFASQSRGEGKT